MKETLKHQEAFNCYYSLGPKRGYTEVARNLAVSRTAVAEWGRAFAWQERVEQRDAENARRLEEKTNDSVVATKANYRKIVRAAIGRWVENYKAKAVNLDTAADLERLIKLDLLLLGEATERGEYSEIDRRSELLSRINQIIARRTELSGKPRPNGGGGTS